MDRKNFFKKACLAGACFCGFGNISGQANNNVLTSQDNNKELKNEWLSNLLSNLSQDLEEEVVRNIVKKSAMAHYNDLNMTAMLSEYIGDLEKFNKYIESNWGWKIDYNKTTKVLIADENKDYCSEGFAEKMFSVVNGRPVTAKVISSVRKGDKSCKYKIEL